jgi:predicted N-formylglutamate amidohydrolase
VAEAEWTPVEITGATGAAPIVLVCEHAACEIPAELDGLGLDDAARRAHVAWDIGAAALARRLSERLEAPLVSGGVSRLVYDCNRPFSAPDCIPEKSELFVIPGNRDLDAAARQARHESIHDPFHRALAETCSSQTRRCGQPITLITVHSFTPVFMGVHRDVEIGFLHHDDPTLAEAALAAEAVQGVYRTALNQPYAASDRVTYTLARHGEIEGRRAVMIEVRNDLIETDEAAERMGDHLCGTLTRALAATAQAGAAE